MEEITRNLRRSIKESCRNAQENLRTREIDKPNRIEIENKFIEEYAKKHNLWLPISDIYKMEGAFPSGNENDVFFSENEQVSVSKFLKEKKKASKRNQSKTVWKIM